MVIEPNIALNYVRFAHRTSLTTRLLWVALRACFPQKALRYTGRLTLR